MLDKCDYCCNQNLSSQKGLVSAKNFETRSRVYINLYIMGRLFNMYTIISMHLILEQSDSHLLNGEQP